MTRVKICNLIFSLCNQRTDKVQICSTDTHGQDILASCLKPNYSLQSGYLLKQTPYPGLLIHVFCQTEIRAAQCPVSAQFWDGASWKKCCIFRGLWSKEKSATQTLMKVGTIQAAAETPQCWAMGDGGAEQTREIKTHGLIGNGYSPVKAMIQLPALLLNELLKPLSTRRGFKIALQSTHAFSF